MQQSVGDIFAAVSRELRRLAGLTASLQDQLSARGYDGLDLETCQSVDDLNQTLDGLAGYVAQISALVPEGSSVAIDAAIDPLGLAALADRLRGCHSAAPAARIELF